MICEKIKENIIREAKMHLLEEDYPKIDKMFRECYKLYESGHTTIVLAPIYSLAMKFDLDNGLFLGPEDWQYAKENGELIEWQ